MLQYYYNGQTIAVQESDVQRALTALKRYAHKNPDQYTYTLILTLETGELEPAQETFQRIVHENLMRFLTPIEVQIGIYYDRLHEPKATKYDITTAIEWTLHDWGNAYKHSTIDTWYN